MRTLLVFLLAILTLAGCTAPSPSQLHPPTPLLAPTKTSSPTSSMTAAPSASPEPTIQGALQIPNPQGYQWQVFVSGLNLPVDIQNAGNGSGWLFVVEREGRIRIIENGRVLSQPFLDISDKLTSNGSEQGLLGLVFHPQYGVNGYFYVNYTDRRGDTVIARFQASTDPSLADTKSEQILLTITQPYANHNGGGLAFGPDGYLYIALGDGGAGGDPNGNAQSGHTLLGKILRVDVDSSEPYAIPPDNPFAGSEQASPEIWASGLRNPWRISFDRQNGDLYIGDVGQGEWEEIDYVPAGMPGGLNFGWDYFEGNHPYEGNATVGGYVFPVAEYSHADGCSVTGGAVYRGASLPEWKGVYLFGDFCTGRIWGLIQPGSEQQAQVLFESGFGISTFGVDELGEIYLANYGAGEVYKLSSR